MITSASSSFSVPMVFAKNKIILGSAALFCLVPSESLVRQYVYGTDGYGVISETVDKTKDTIKTPRLFLIKNHPNAFCTLRIHICQ